MSECEPSGSEDDFVEEDPCAAVYLDDTKIRQLRSQLDELLKSLTTSKTERHKTIRHILNKLLPLSKNHSKQEKTCLVDDSEIIVKSRNPTHAQDRSQSSPPTSTTQQKTTNISITLSSTHTVQSTDNVPPRLADCPSVTPSTPGVSSVPSDRSRAKDPWGPSQKLRSPDRDSRVPMETRRTPSPNHAPMQCPTPSGEFDLEATDQDGSPPPDSHAFIRQFLEQFGKFRARSKESSDRMSEVRMSRQDGEQQDQDEVREQDEPEQGDQVATNWQNIQQEIDMLKQCQEEQIKVREQDEPEQGDQLATNWQNIQQEIDILKQCQEEQIKEAVEENRLPLTAVISQFLNKFEKHLEGAKERWESLRDGPLMPSSEDEEEGAEDAEVYVPLCDEGVQLDVPLCDEGVELDYQLCDEDVQLDDPLCDEGVDVDVPLCAEGAQLDDQLCDEGVDVDVPLCAEGVQLDDPLCDEGVDVDVPLCAEGVELDYQLCDEDVQLEDPLCDEGVDVDVPLCDEGAQLADQLCDEGVQFDDQLCDDGLADEQQQIVEDETSYHQPERDVPFEEVDTSSGLRVLRFPNPGEDPAGIEEQTIAKRYNARLIEFTRDAFDIDLTLNIEEIYSLRKYLLLRRKQLYEYAKCEPTFASAYSAVGYDVWSLINRINDRIVNALSMHLRLKIKEEIGSKHQNQEDLAAVERTQHPIRAPIETRAVEYNDTLRCYHNDAFQDEAILSAAENKERISYLQYRLKTLKDFIKKYKCHMPENVDEYAKLGFDDSSLTHALNVKIRTMIAKLVSASGSALQLDQLQIGGSPQTPTSPKYEETWTQVARKLDFLVN